MANTSSEISRIFQNLTEEEKGSIAEWQEYWDIDPDIYSKIITQGKEEIEKSYLTGGYASAVRTAKSSIRKIKNLTDEQMADLFSVIDSISEKKRDEPEIDFSKTSSEFARTKNLFKDSGWQKDPIVHSIEEFFSLVPIEWMDFLPSVNQSINFSSGIKASEVARRINQGRGEE